MNKRVIVVGMLFLISLSEALANPVVPGIHIRLANVVAIALIVEGLIVAGLLASKGFCFSRAFFSWLIVTFVTYWYSSGLLPSMEWGIFDSIYWMLTFILEIAIVLIEAWIIMRMSESPFFREQKGSFLYRTAMLVSLSGNAVSFLIALISKSYFYDPLTFRL